MSVILKSALYQLWLSAWIFVAHVTAQGRQGCVISPQSSTILSGETDVILLEWTNGDLGSSQKILEELSIANIINFSFGKLLLSI